MSCMDKGILRAKLDGELHGRELEKVESHLAACAFAWRDSARPGIRARALSVAGRAA